MPDAPLNGAANSVQKTPDLQFSVTCLNLDDKEGPPTFQYLFYELPLPALPFKLDRFFLLNCWINGVGQFRHSVRILNPSRTKTLIDTGDQTFVLTDAHTPQLMINHITDFMASEAGPHWVQTYLDGRMILEYPVTVRVAEKKRPGIPVMLQLPIPDAHITRFSPAAIFATTP